jgi:hypothetical protein
MALILGCNWILYATALLFPMIWNGPTYRGASFRFTPKRLTLFIGETFR